MSNKKAQTCSKTVLGYRRVVEECLFCSKLGQNLSETEVRTFVRIQRVIWDHLLAFNPFTISGHLQILLCLTPDDFTRQRETLGGERVKKLSPLTLPPPVVTYRFYPV